MNEADAVEQMTAAFPVTLQTPTGDLVLESQPTRILSLSPTATEILFAIGAGEQVIAVDDQSNYPPEAPTSDISGFTPNLEAILALEPDLVVHSYLPEDIEQGLSNVGIPSLTQYAAASLDDTYQQITSSEKRQEQVLELKARFRKCNRELMRLWLASMFLMALL